MIATIIIVGLALYQLMRETDWLRIRLLIGAEKIYIPKVFEPILCRNCNYGSRLHSWRTCHKAAERWSAWQIPARTVKAFGSTINFNKGCNWYRASLLRDIYNAHTTNRAIAGLKARVMPAMYNPGGAHPEFNLGKWHPKIKYFEPEIEILVDGQSKAKFNGNYKRGMIKQVIKANK